MKMAKIGLTGRTKGTQVPTSPSARKRSTAPRETVTAAERVVAMPRGAVLRHLAGVADEGRLLFVAGSKAGEPTPVVIGCEVSDGVLVRAARGGRRAVVLRADEGRLVLIGLVRERVTSEARDAG